MGKRQILAMLLASILATGIQASHEKEEEEPKVSGDRIVSVPGQAKVSGDRIVSVPGQAKVKFEKGGDRIVSLPGQPKVKFEQFSGYVTVNRASGRALFYWLTQAQTDPASKPLVIWLNGGPGCSSVAYGASEEIGPFRIKKRGGGLSLNKFSWNSVANLLFLESPAGVGFSYSNRSSDLRDTGDLRTAKDSLEFVIRWLERFPEYEGREVYLTGESYAGHYVPQLAREILAYNENHSGQAVNLRGVMVGNAVTDSYYDNVGTVTYWWTHAMISDKTYRELLSRCHFGRDKESEECESSYSYAMDTEFGNIDQYNIYAPPCVSSSDSSDSTSTTSHQRRRHMRLPHRPFSLRTRSGYDPCTERRAEVYYNRPDVQRALHANITKIPYKWTACSEVLNRNWNDTELSVLPIYKQMIAAGLRVWVFSGDVDSVVPVTATRFSLARLNLPTKIPWYPWYVKKQVGGWTEVYEGVTFATVRGAGHEVPLFKPRAALQLFNSFLQGTHLPNN